MRIYYSSEKRKLGDEGRTYHNDYLLLTVSSKEFSFCLLGLWKMGNGPLH